MKRMGLFLMAVVLATTALVSEPVAAGAQLLCHNGPACWVGPRCCSDLMCAGFCENLNPGSTPHCSGDASVSGCCGCEAP